MLVQVQKLDAQVKEDGAALGQKPRDSEQVGGWVGERLTVDGWMDGWHGSELGWVGDWLGLGRSVGLVGWVWFDGETDWA